MYNKHPYFGSHFKKKKGSRKQRKWLHKKSVKNHDLDTLKKRNITRCTGWSTKRLFLWMDFFWWSATVKSWVRELRSICKELELNWCFLLRILLSHFQSFELQRFHKQACSYMSPGHHIANTKLQILARFSSNFVAIIMLQWSAKSEC